MSEFRGPAIPVGVSNRHAHLSQKDLEVLFGEGYSLNEMRPLSMPGQFAAEETVTIVGPKGCLTKVRILGPTRKQTQVEVSRTDCFTLGVNPPVRDSGDLKGSAPLVVVGPKGAINLTEGLIVAIRHIHMEPKDAEAFGVKDREVVSVEVPGERSLVFKNVLCRVDPTFRLELHLDTDEANGAGLGNRAEVRMLK